MLSEACKASESWPNFSNKGEKQLWHSMVMGAPQSDFKIQLPALILSFRFVDLTIWEAAR